MTETNHRRPARRPPSDISEGAHSRSGHLSESMPWKPRKWYGKGRIDTLILSDRSIGAGVGQPFFNGHRGAARMTLGAKKFIRIRTRFHENAATRRLAIAAVTDRDDP